MGEPFLEVQKITKRFPGVVALSGVDLQVYPAEILALIGENGAGKSTLMKILAGVQAADDGELLVKGKVVRFSGVQDAQKSGIALIHQELNLAENPSVNSSVKSVHKFVVKSVRKFLVKSVVLVKFVRKFGPVNF